MKYNLFSHQSKFISFTQDVYYCNNCDFIQTNVIDKNYLDYLYSFGDDYNNYSDNLLDEKKNYIHRVDIALALFEGMKISFDSMLDVGSCTGLLLSKCKNKIIQGVETSEAGVYTSKKRYGVDVYKGTFQDFCKDFPNIKFDIISMCHVLEHIEDINEWINLVKEKCSKYVYIEVPCFSNRIKNEPYGFFAQEHLNYWTPYSLLFFMKRNKFFCKHLDIDYMVEDRIANGFPMIRALFTLEENDSYLCKPVITSEYSLKKYMKWSARQIDYLNRKINELPKNSKITIWGASFQTERFLANIKLEKFNIVSIVDNSETKTKLKISVNNKILNVIKPDDFNFNTVDYILISTWNNFGPIKNYLEKLNYSDKIINIFEKEE